MKTATDAKVVPIGSRRDASIARCAAVKLDSAITELSDALDHTDTVVIGALTELFERDEVAVCQCLVSRLVRRLNALAERMEPK